MTKIKQLKNQIDRLRLTKCTKEEDIKEYIMILEDVLAAIVDILDDRIVE